LATSITLKKPKTVIYKTIYEFCRDDINVELEALAIAKHLGEFSVDDLHVLDPSVEKMGLTTNVYGPTICGLLRRGNIELVAFVPSSRRDSHHRRVGLYRYVKG
jgi:hypothetical protein